MAESPSHLFGQIIGDIFEETFHTKIKSFCERKGLFLDKKGTRPAREGMKVSWVDKYGSTHDLDFVIEKNGSATKIGEPVAFIESAWRRYTKHSKNKAQEIQGAILPLAETYSNSHPFLGAVLSGEFTGNAIDQLKAQGFEVLYIPYAKIIDAFKVVKMDAAWVETTPDSDLQSKIDAWNKLTVADKQKVKDAIIASSKTEIDTFFANLEQSIDRLIELIVIIPLYGKIYNLKTVADAISFVDNFKTEETVSFQKFEAEIRYNNKDVIKGSFSNIQRLREFLLLYQ